MRYCPRCGYPKELHSKPDGVSSARQPKVAAPELRQCSLVENDDQDLPLTTYRADANEYKRRWDAYRSERDVRLV